MAVSSLSHLTVTGCEAWKTTVMLSDAVAAAAAAAAAGGEGGELAAVK